MPKNRRTVPAAKVIGDFVEHRRYPNGRHDGQQPTITQKQLADRAGLYQPSISDWEQGFSVPNAVNFCLLMKHLQVHPNELHRLVRDVANQAEVSRRRGDEAVA